MRDDLADENATDAGFGPTGQLTPANPAAGVESNRLIPPLHWWRTLPASTFTSEHVETVAKTLSVFLILGEPQWKAAIAGDATAAIGVALRVTKDCQLPTAAVDIAMTALLRPALVGDAGAALVMATIIERMVGGANGLRLASAWLATGGLLADQRCRLTRLTFHNSSDDNRE